MNAPQTANSKATCRSLYFPLPRSGSNLKARYRVMLAPGAQGQGEGSVLPSPWSAVNLVKVDAIDRLAMNARLHFLGSAARIVEPVQKLAVLTCMDARVDVSGLLGLRPGDAHVIRNAGGRATGDALRAIAVSQAVMATREVMVMHHTECALGRFSQAQLAEQITAATGHPFHEDLDCFTDPVAAIVEDLERLKAYPWLAHRDKIRGFMYDLTANTLTEVFPSPAMSGKGSG